MAKQIGVRIPFPTPKRTPNTRVGADLLLKEIRASNKKLDLNDNPLLPAYVVCVCAAIEARLNEAYIKHFHMLVGYGYEQYVAPYLRMRIEEKFGMLIPLLSGFKLEVNRKNDRVAFLFKVFRLRNRLVHQVAHLVQAEFEWADEHSAYMHYPQDQYRYAHSHPEWEILRRLDLVAIHAALNFWMPWLNDIPGRIKHKSFNHNGVCKAIPRT